MNKGLLNFILGAIGAFYLINPTAGLFELIPDNIPVIGNLDEAAAAILVLGALRYFGIDLTSWMHRRKNVNLKIEDNNVK